MDIHLEGCNDNGEKLIELAKIGKPFTISPVPVFTQPPFEYVQNGIYSKDQFYSPELMGILKEILTEPQIMLGQQGYSHYCDPCFEQKHKRDPWHENMCLYQDGFSVRNQFITMKIGKEILENKFKVSPELYVPPNHQFDENTKQATINLGFEYFAIQGILNISPYFEKDLIILPERKPGKSGKCSYVHYDQMEGDFPYYLDLVKNSSPLEDISPCSKQGIKSMLNDELVILKKGTRDWMKKF